MWIFRNKEFVGLGVLALVFWAATVAVGAWLSPAAAGMAAVCGLFWNGVLVFWQRRRYDSMRRLAKELDKVLHGEKLEDMAHFKEGDLEILRSQIWKMTLRLQEQAELLQEEKTGLAHALADISHQIRTPLTAANILLERLKNPVLSGEERRRLFYETEQMLDKIQWLVTSLLKMSRLDAGAITMKPQDISAETFLRDAIKPLEIPMEVHQKTCKVTGAEGVSFEGDYDWTLEAVGNVLKNGMEYTPDGGCLYVSCTDNPLYTEITITDGGTGIPEEDLPHLFERFYRGKNAGKDSFGIGLALSRMILSKENAVILARNTPEGHGEFCIRFYKTVL